MKKVGLNVALLLGVIMPFFVNAEVNLVNDKQGINVTTSDFENLLNQAPANAQLKFLNDKAKVEQRVREMYLTKAIAEQSKQTPLTAEEQNELNNLTTRFYFQRKMGQLAKENLPDFEPLAKLQFDTHKAEYMNPERIAAEHILLDKNKYKENEALKLASDIVARLKKGEQFDVLAAKYSDDPSVKDNKGKLGLFAKGQMVKEFEDAAFAMQPNEVSKPVKTMYGYHIIRVYEHIQPTPKSYGDVKEELIGKIKQDYFKQQVDEFYDKVKTENAMEVDANALNNFLEEKTKQLKASTNDESKQLNIPK